MPDTNNTNNDNNKNKNDKNNNQTPVAPKGSSVVIGCDSNSNDQKMIDTVAKGIQDAGYNVAEKFAVGPSPFSTYAYTNAAKDKIGIYLMADSLFSFADGYHDLYAFDIFVIRGGVGGGINSQQDFETKTLGADPDCNSVCNEWIGLTYPQMNEKAKGKCVAIYGGKTPEEALQAALSALSGAGVIATGSSTPQTGSTGGGGAVKIPDVTFYGLIKQIIGAIDGLFVIANNIAYLLTFQDMFKYRIDNDDDIPTIEPSDVIRNTVKKNWTTAGYYNAVEVTYNAGTIRYQHDTLVKQYGEHVYYYDCESDDYETAKDKAQALLSAHVRDYSTDIELQIFYNPNITAGSWIKLKKSITQISGQTLKERQQEELKAQGKKIETKRKGINITNISEEIIQEDNIKKKIRHLTDKKGEKIDIEEEQSDYDIFFVQSYNCKWDEYNSLIMNLYLKYGPDTPEDPINATIGVGGTTTNNAAGAVAAGGLWGNDTFTINDICVANNAKIDPGYDGGARVQEIKQLVNGKYAPEPSDYQPRANPNSNYAKKYSQMKSPAEVYAAFRSEYKYSKYADNCECWKNATDFYDNAGKTANCGDTTCLLKVFFDCIGVPSCGVHIDGHYFNAIQINGTWEIIDGVRLDNQTCGFADGNGYSFGNPYPCDSYKSNGGDANNGGNNG